MNAETVSAPTSVLGEGPRWFRGQLTWVDIMAGRIHRLSADGAAWSESLAQPVSLVLPRANGAEVRTQAATIVTVDPDGTAATLAVLDDSGELRCNDGTCAPDGALFVGTMRYDGTGRDGKLFRVDADGAAEVILSGLGISNGIAFVSDQLAYYIDSADRRIDLLDVTTGERDEFVVIEDPHAVPDGMTVDRDGAVWVALFGGRRVLRYLADGTLDRTIDVPAPNVTSCTFGGAELTDLYITTAREHMSADEIARDPLAGSLFCVRDAGHGRATLPFAG